MSRAIGWALECHSKDIGTWHDFRDGAAMPTTGTGWFPVGPMAADDLLLQVDCLQRAVSGGWVAYIDVPDPVMPGVRVTGVGATPRAAVLDAIRVRQGQPAPPPEPEEEIELW